ncbi:MAG: cytochrome c3 family protein, partial [bacterium]
MHRVVVRAFAVLIMLGPTSDVWAQSDEDCFACHNDPEFSIDRDGKEVPLFVDEKKLRASIHGDFDCTTCHMDLDGTELPHDENVQPVDCGMCHDDIAEVYADSLHGQAVHAGEKLAPRCWDCHGAHDIAPLDSPNSKVTKFNIPFVCGRCHKEGTEVTQTYDIPQDHILSHYSESIHGEGLFKQGLTVTAVCTDCHTSHNVLPHTDPRSSIYRDNVPKTCQKCHGRIEQVHLKWIRGELWEKEPNKVPICVDCHAPHEIRKVIYEL